MLSGVWSLCHWLLTEVVHRSIIQTNTNTQILPLFYRLQSLFYSFYTHAIDYRVNITQFLTKFCLTISTQNQNNGKYTSSSLSSLISPLGSVKNILNNFTTTSLPLTHAVSDFQSNQQHTKYSCILLEGILKGHPTAANDIYLSIMNLINSQSNYDRYTSSSTSHDDKRKYCHLPRAFLFHRFHSIQFFIYLFI